MTEPLKPDELAAIVARAEAATPGKRRYVSRVVHVGDKGNWAAIVQTDEEGVFITHAREDVPRLAAEVTQLQEYSEEVRKGINAALREYARANTRLAAAREKAEKLKEAAKGRDFTLELETAIADLAAALEEK